MLGSTVDFADSAMGEFFAPGNSTVGEEFPYWRLAMAVRVIMFVFFIVPLAIFFNTSILLTFIVTKKLHRPINLMHIALIIELFLVKYVGNIMATFTFPNQVRFCICWNLPSEIYLSLVTFNIAFLGVLLTCLSVAQLLIIRGKKKLITWKVIGVLIMMSTMYNTVLAVLSFFSNRLQNTPLLCASLCTETPSLMLNNFSLFLVALIVVVLLPCLVVTFIALLWSCLIFKSSYIGDDDQLTRRIVSLPAIMPVLTLFTTILFFVLQQLGARLLRQIVTSFYPNWVIFLGEIQAYLFEGVSGFIYPVVLLYFNPKLRLAWKVMLKRAREALCKKCAVKKKERRSTQVHPEPQEVNQNATDNSTTTGTSC